MNNYKEKQAKKKNPVNLNYEERQKMKIFKRCFWLSAVLLITSAFFAWVDIKIGDFIINIPDWIGVIGTLIFGVLSLIFLKKYYQLKERML